jgi:hypothetical protein
MGGPGGRLGRLAICGLAAVLITSCGGRSGHSHSPLTLSQVQSNLKKSGYRITVYGPGEGILHIDSVHKADAGFSIDYSPTGQQLYAGVYETRNPAVRAAIMSHYSDSARPIVRGSLIFTISGTAPELEQIVKDAGDAGPSTSSVSPGSSTAPAAAKAALQTFIDAYAAGEERSVCASLTRQALEKSQTFCNPRSTFYRRKADPRVRRYIVTDVTVTGDKAMATVSFDGVTELVALRRVDGLWKISTELGAGRLF